jgi:hypothetical protein
VIAGIKWSQRFSYCVYDTSGTNSDPSVYVQYDCVLPVGQCLNYLVILYFVYFALAIYLDAVRAHPSTTVY